MNASSRWRMLSSCFVAALAVAAAPAVACLWDNDTLKDERRGLPDIADVLAGKWEKHSQFFYARRVERMKERLAADPNDLAAYDNLAVAYEKLGDQDKAIEAILEKDKVKPGEYTTHANLGTFYLHKGDFENGIRHIKEALRINPDAHFGREEYQLKLAEFLQESKKDPSVWDRGNFLGFNLEPDQHVYYAGSPDTLARTLAEHGIRDNVFDGIVGMIRFGTGTGAELYRALGDLLTLRGDKILAYRAYQRAVDFGHPKSDAIRRAMNALREVIGDQDATTAEAIAAERAEAERWVEAFQEYENGLLREGIDTDDEANYAAFYREHGRPGRQFTPPAGRLGRVAMAVGGAVALAAVGAAGALWRRRRHVRRAAPPVTTSPYSLPS